MPDLLAGTTVRGLDFPKAVSDRGDTSFDATNTTFGTASTGGTYDEVGVVFTALVLNPFIAEDDLLRLILQDFGVVPGRDPHRRPAEEHCGRERDARRPGDPDRVHDRVRDGGAGHR